VETLTVEETAKLVETAKLEETAKLVETEKLEEMAKLEEMETQEVTIVNTLLQMDMTALSSMLIQPMHSISAISMLTISTEGTMVKRI
jgi:hypothetical protein